MNSAPSDPIELNPKYNTVKELLTCNACAMNSAPSDPIELRYQIQHSQRIINM